MIYLGFYLECNEANTFHSCSDPNWDACSQPAAFALSNNWAPCNTHFSAVNQPCALPKLLKDPHFYWRLPNDNISKKIHSTRLGINYEVTIKKYNEFKGKKNPTLRKVMEPTTTIGKKGSKNERIYYKEYKNLTFDIVRSLAQISRWNRLTKSTFISESRKMITKPYILNESSPLCPKPAVFKQLSHVMDRNLPPQYSSNAKKRIELEHLKSCTKNWLRRTKKWNKLKKQLPLLPENTPGDARLYYYKTYNINLFDYKVQRRFDVSTIPQYNYGYTRAKQLYEESIKKCSRPLIIENLSSRDDALNSCVILTKYCEIINDRNTFFTRLTPPRKFNDNYVEESDQTGESSRSRKFTYPPTLSVTISLIIFLQNNHGPISNASFCI